MADQPIDPPANDRDELPDEWFEAAVNASHNLGFDKPLPRLSPEHWQQVLASVAARMRMRGVSLPTGWEDIFAHHFGRYDR